MADDSDLVAILQAVREHSHVGAATEQIHDLYRIRYAGDRMAATRAGLLVGALVTAACWGLSFLLFATSGSAPIVATHWYGTPPPPTAIPLPTAPSLPTATAPPCTGRCEAHAVLARNVRQLDTAWNASEDDAEIARLAGRDRFMADALGNRTCVGLMNDIVSLGTEGSDGEMGTIIDLAISDC